MNPSTHELRELLRACRRGNEHAARTLHARCAPALLVYARSILRDEALAEDAVQGAFCRVFRMPRREVECVESPQSWLASMTRHEALTLLRTRRRAAARERRFLPHVASARRVASAPGDPDQLRRAIDALPRRLREIVVLKHVAGMTFDQISVALSLNRNTAAARYRAAMNRLRTALADSDQEAIHHHVH